MGEIVYLRRNEAVTTSLIVAERFHKRHDHVLRDIENILINLPKNGVVKFNLSTYTDAKGESRKMYEMNKNAFSLLVMGFNGKKALEWKIKYVEAFAAMENILQEKTTQAWIETRSQGMIIRKAETDGIKDFIEYALSQGSEHADKYYMIFSSLANKLAGVKKRDSASTIQLNNLAIYENIILRVIQEGIKACLPYKTIYQNCKNRCEQAKEIALLA